MLVATTLLDIITPFLVDVLVSTTPVEGITSSLDVLLVPQ